MNTPTDDVREQNVLPNLPRPLDQPIARSQSLEHRGTLTLDTRRPPP